MSKHSDIDLNTFLEKVLNEYHTLKSFKQAEMFDENVIRKGFGDNSWGCLFIPIFGMVNKFGLKTLTEQKNKRNYQVFENEAEVLISQDVITKAICKSIKSLNKNEILTEDRFVKVVTETLTENNLRKQFVIPLEPVLFAFIAFIIFQKGLDKFCDEI